MSSHVAASEPDTGETDFELLADSNPGGIVAIGENAGQIAVAKADFMDFEGAVAPLQGPRDRPPCVQLLRPGRPTH